MYHEQIVSKLLLGFVERRISPQTILDCILAQIFEEKVPAASLTHATSNGIIEALSPASQLEGVHMAVLYVASHPDFPSFLTPKAALHGLLLLMTKPCLQDPAYLQAVDGFCEACLNNIKYKKMTTEQLLTLQEALARPGAKNLALRSPGATRLCMEIFCSPQIKTAPSPENCLLKIFQTPEEGLLTLSPADFDHGGPRAWAMENISVLVDKLHRSQWVQKPYHQGFLTQWFFSNSLELIYKQEISLAHFHNAISLVLETAPRIWVLRGLLKAWQDHTSHVMAQNTEPLLPSRVQALISPYFWHLCKGLSEEPAIWGPLWKPLVAWSIQCMVSPPRSRLVERSSWQWVRVLASGTWEDGLTGPAPWVVSTGEQSLPILCQVAPPLWLKTYLLPVIEKLYQDFQKPSFAISKAHFDHLETVLRTLMHRVQDLHDCPEILMGLKMLGRLTTTEEATLSLFQTRIKLQSQGYTVERRSLWSQLAHNPSGAFLGSTPLSRSLGLLKNAFVVQH